MPGAIGRRIVRAGAIGFGLALLVFAAGLGLERVRFGAADQRALERVERELRQRFDAAIRDLDQLAAVVSSNHELIRIASRDPGEARPLFERLEMALPPDVRQRTGVTVYSASGMPVAWLGRVSDLPRSRVNGSKAVFVASGAFFGPRLVRIEPVVSQDRRSPGRLGTITVEQLLSNPPPAAAADPLLLSDLFVPVQLRTDNPLAGQTTHSFVIESDDGTRLVDADVRPADLAAARGRWRAGVLVAVLMVVAFTLLALAALAFELRQRSGSWRGAIGATIAFVALLVSLRLTVLRAVALVAGAELIAAAELLLSAGLLLTLVVLAADSIEQLRVARPHRPLLPAGTGAAARTAVAYAIAGIVDVALLWSYQRFLYRVVASTPVDPLQFSLFPLTGGRLVLAFGLVLLHAAVIWSSALVIRLAALIWRTPRARGRRVVAALAWLGGVGLGALVAAARFPAVPYLPLASTLAAAAAGTVLLARPRRPMRRASQAARLFGVYIALLIPALAAYPSLHAFAVQVKEDRVATRFGPQAASLRDELQRLTQLALADIDGTPALESFFNVSSEEGATTNLAYVLWSRTALSKSRLTSSVELFDARGNLISRFALNLPEYETRGAAGASCTPASESVKWDVFEDVSHVLQASRAICVPGARDTPTLAGVVVVRVMLDYGTLPFTASPSPYFESLRGVTDAEEASGRDIEFAMYGWSRAPVYVSGTGTWRLSDDVFDRMVDSRTPFWDTVTRGRDRFRVYFLNDRGGIYALSYPVTSMFGHLMNLAELVILTGALYLLLLMAASLVNVLTAHRLASGAALLREVRSSFYRKLFLAFVAVAVIPAVILAVAARNRLAGQFESGVNDAAVKTALVAQRLVEDYATLPQAGRALADLNDSHMVLVGRAIDQDVTLYNGPTLQATSERDLYESGLLPERAPADVYRSIVLDRQPTVVSIEDVGGSPYLVAAAPVRAAGAERIVTVPQTLRQRELELQIEDLDRRVWSAFVLFVLLGAGLGYWMAERIADPVSRLTRATRRIARGDLDARIAATSSDELRRLVEDFNRMAADLQRQRRELERTQRLEAWADMARQVAHDVKNPLTPIQLSAEHARRINVDRGRPLSPALDECVASILTQVKLLRQIAAEFSSFASSPTPRPELTDLATIVEEVVDPYRVGLAGRISLDIAADPALPPVSIDRTLFARALTNVIENALHAMPGEGRLTISMQEAAESRPRTIRVRITDTGVGMDPEALARIFEPYFSTKASGTGLGLTIAKRNVELNGGKILVESQRGSGTSVTMLLPVPE
jgi:nitrogen fixation/metabolism regulation signal transduction histidine kinase